ncbi:MAG: type II toxin-antitoxin system RelE family toxin [Scandinavium sp.]|uniref:type II toxin-antitoxin system RelE family toxin n=1 Tax=Scandinavium sp. TaxID=2830653 RepID=UPI003F2FEC9D
MQVQQKLTILWSKTARRHFLKIEKRDRLRIIAKLEMLGDISAPPLDIEKLRVPDELYRLRVGDYRIIFTRTGENNEACYIFDVLRRTSKTYSFHEEPASYEYTIYQG